MISLFWSKYFASDCSWNSSILKLLKFLNSGNSWILESFQQNAFESTNERIHWHFTNTLSATSFLAMLLAMCGVYAIVDLYCSLLVEMQSCPMTLPTQKHPPEVFYKKLFLIILQYSEENTCVVVSLLKRACNTNAFLWILRTLTLKNICERMLLQEWLLYLSYLIFLFILFFPISRGSFLQRLE